MYLLYDVIQRRNSALSNSLWVKRKDYNQVQEIISSLSYDQLIAAAESLRTTQKTSDPAITTLRRAIEAVAARVPNSFAEKQEMRLQLRALFIEFGLAAFWLTINPSDLRDPLVIKLAGVVLPQDGLRRANAAFRRRTANMNPAAIAIFFDRICAGVLEALICPSEGEMGILGEVSTYYGVVETNGRGMLHLHCLVWLTGNLDFYDLRKKILNEPDFARRMVEYLDSVISERIDASGGSKNDGSDSQPTESSCPPTQNFGNDQEYVDAMHKYANAVASKRQIHSEKHNSTCFKYSGKSNSRSCRFYFPRPKVSESHVDNQGIVHLRRDNEWINPYNSCIAAAINSNQDLSFLATRTKALALLYYITNYATKDEASTYQMVMNAAMIRKSLDQQNEQNTERTALDKARRNFCLRVFNRMSHDKEVSGVQVASCLLQLPTYYTPRTELHRINLYHLRRRLRSLIQRADDGESRADEQVAIQLGRNSHASSFDDYKWRGPRLKSLCLYEYAKVIGKRPAKHKSETDLDFDSNHPEYGGMTQFVRTSHSIPRTVALVGQLSEYQENEDRIRGGHPQTNAMQNDLAAVLLALFVPWDTLPPLFDDIINLCGDDCNANCDQSSHTGLQVCSIAWVKVRDALPEHIQDFARNVQLLRKSKDDADVDKVERMTLASAMKEAFNPDLDNAQDTLDEVADINGTGINGSVADDTLRLSYNLIRRRWITEDRSTVSDIEALRLPWQELPSLTIENYTPVAIDSVPGTRLDVTPDTLKQWSVLVNGGSVPIIPDSNQTAIDTIPNVDGFANNEVNDDAYSNADNEYAAVEPVLTFMDPSMSTDLRIPQLAIRLGQHPSPIDISNLVSEIAPLNPKQKRTVSMVFYHVMRLHGRPIVEKEDQFLLYVAGEGGTGKSRVVEAIKLGMELLGREKEVVVTAPTGNSANHIQGNTIHTALDVMVHGRRRRRASGRTSDVSRRVRSLWPNKTILIIDEISMVSSHLMNSIDNRCKLVKNLESNSTAVFGGLPIVIALGDFHQFSPVRAKALWQTQTSPKEKRGQELWHMFKDVVILDEQMRQQRDVDYHQLLQRARNSCVTQTDVDRLNTRLLPQLEAQPELMQICIVRSNKLRHAINRLQIESFARLREQKIFIFPARHTRRKKDKASGSRDIEIQKLLEIQENAETKGPGLLLYTQNMPTVLLSNISTPFGLVNGAQGEAVGFVPDPYGKFPARLETFKTLLTDHSEILSHGLTVHLMHTSTEMRAFRTNPPATIEFPGNGFACKTYLLLGK
jgi:Helitron helicase-like domain at N-terminus/PIF1-like helicase